MQPTRPIHSIYALVTDIRPLAEAEALHERVERGEVTGRAALLIG